MKIGEIWYNKDIGKVKITNIKYEKYNDAFKIDYVISYSWLEMDGKLPRKIFLTMFERVEK